MVEGEAAGLPISLCPLENNAATRIWVGDPGLKSETWATHLIVVRAISCF
jgi:hypothetical protein